MIIIAELTLSPGFFFGWVVTGVLAGWLAARVMKGGGYGFTADAIVGLIGAVSGGLLFEITVTGEIVFWNSMLAAFIGACLLLAAFRFLGFGRPGI